MKCYAYPPPPPPPQLKSNRIVALSLFMLLLFLFVQPVMAAGSITVDATCSLADAISAANSDTATGGCAAGSGTDTITITEAGTNNGTITLSSELDVHSNIRIEGGGFTISGGNKTRIFAVWKKYVLSINALTLRDAKSSSFPNQRGGAVRASSGRINISNSRFINNSANGFGGALYTGDGSISVRNSSFSGNSAGDEGGAIHADDGSVSVSNSSFSGNSAGDEGGALYTDSGSMSVSNSSFSGNSAGNDGDALYTRNGSITATHNTIRGDVATDFGALALRNNIIGSVLVSDERRGSKTLAGNLIGGEPKLGALTGSPAYFPLQAGSPAIDAADARYCLSVDQTYVARPQGNGCDIGAYESSLTLANRPTAAPTSVPTATSTPVSHPVSLNGSACTLVDAIKAANSDAASGSCPAGNGADTITFSAGVQLHSELPDISSNISFKGGGHSLSRFVALNDWADDFRLLTIKSGATVSIDNLTLAHGVSLQGGAIYNAGSLTISNSTLRDNLAHYIRGVIIINYSPDTHGITRLGGGIYNSGSLVISNSTLRDNESRNEGGAIFNRGSLTITGSTFSKNEAAWYGGAIANGEGELKNGKIAQKGGALSIRNSVFKDNLGGPAHDGQHIVQADNLAGLSISGTTFSGGRPGGHAVFCLRSDSSTNAACDGYKDVIEQTGPTATPPPSPVMRVTGTSATSINIEWDAYTGATGYGIQVILKGVQEYFKTVKSSVTDYEVTGLAAEKDYVVRLIVYLTPGTAIASLPAKTLASADSLTPTAGGPTPTATSTSTATPHPYASLIQTLLTYQAETQSGAEHVERWTRALAALGYGSHANPVTVSEAQGYVNQGWTRWQPVLDALKALNPPTTSTPVPPTSTATDIPPPTATNTPTPTATATPSPTHTATATATPTNSPSPTNTASPTASPVPSDTPTATATPTNTATATDTPEGPRLPTDGSLGLVFSAISKDHITVQWSDMGQVLLYFLEISAGSYYDLGTFSTGSASHTFSGLQADTAYFVRITAYLNDETQVAQETVRTLPEAQVEEAQDLPRSEQVLEPTPTDTPVAPPTDTPVAPPTDTPVAPPTDTPLPTDTPIPPTNTPLPTDTPIPPTNTPLPTNTPVPPPTEAPKSQLPTDGRFAIVFSAITKDHITVEWSEAPDADSYTLVFFGGDSFESPTFYAGEATSHTFGGLSPNTSYTAELYAYRSDGGSAGETRVTGRTLSDSPPTNTPIPPTNTPIPPPTNTPVPPPTNTPVPPPTNTPIPPPTNTPVPPPTNTPVPPPTNTPIPPPTNTPIPPPTNTPIPPPTNTPIPPPTNTPVPPPTNTPVPPPTNTPVPPPTNTPIPPPTNTPVPPPTNTPIPPPTNTPIPPPTNTPIPPPAEGFSISFSAVGQDSVTVNWTGLAGPPVYTLLFHNDEIFEIFTFDYGETTQTIAGLRADTQYTAEVFAYLNNGGEESASGKVRTLAG